MSFTPLPQDQAEDSNCYEPCHPLAAWHSVGMPCLLLQPLNAERRLFEGVELLSKIYNAASIVIKIH